LKFVVAQRWTALKAASADEGSKKTGNAGVGAKAHISKLVLAILSTIERLSHTLTLGGAGTKRGTSGPLPEAKAQEQDIVDDLAMITRQATKAARNYSTEREEGGGEDGDEEYDEGEEEEEEKDAAGSTGDGAGDFEMTGAEQLAAFIEELPEFDPLQTNPGLIVEKVRAVHKIPIRIIHHHIICLFERCH
jgi:hypothetical protein